MVLLVGMAVATFSFGDEVAVVRDELRRWGLAGIGVYVLMHLLWTLTTVPTIPLMGLAGIVYGPWIGTACALAGGILGFTATFWIGRTALRDRVSEWAKQHRRFARALRLVERHEAISVLIVRLVPLFPLNLMNYGFGTTKVRFRTYIAVSLVAFVPGAALYAGLGELLWHAAASENGVTPGMAIWVGALVVISVGLGYAVTRLYRRTVNGGTNDAGTPVPETSSSSAVRGT